ncbi:MAG: transglutaminase-like domain-containing protein [Thermoplasmata archaeon]
MNIQLLSISLPENIKREVFLGNISNAEYMINSYIKNSKDELLKERLKIELERLKRLNSVFNLKRKDIIRSLKNNVRDFDNTELENLIKDGLVDRVFINGEERFMERAVDNVFFLSNEMRKRRISPKKEDNELLQNRIKKIIEGDVSSFRITAGIEIDLDKEAPYHVWLPVPMENETISNVKILKTYPEKYRISENSKQKTINFFDTEKKFTVEFSYDISETKLSRKGSSNITEFLDEKKPHVVFTEHLRYLTDKIIASEESDYKKAWKIYKWITENVYYSYVPSYIYFDNISEYTATNLRGDCGFMAILFITMCRIAGIPAKWQSGWYITIEKATPHDWAQVYIDGYGFIPVDASFGNVLKGNNKFRDFYFGNLDAFRMIANEDFQEKFDPEKRYIRLDPIDNQVGEVETESGNIYDFRSRIYVKSFEKIH